MSLPSSAPPNANGMVSELWVQSCFFFQNICYKRANTYGEHYVL